MAQADTNPTGTTPIGAHRTGQAVRLDGKATAAAIRVELTERVAALAAKASSRARDGAGR